MFLTHIKEFALRNQIRMLLLSAVLPNADDLIQWITSDSELAAKSDGIPALERLGLLLWDGNRVRLEWKSEGESFNPNFIQKGPLGFRRKAPLGEVFSGEGERPFTTPPSFYQTRVVSMF